jgi:hypothetical protein
MICFSVESAEQPSDSSSAPEAAAADEPRKLVESKRLKLFMSCIAGHNESFAVDL